MSEKMVSVEALKLPIDGLKVTVAGTELRDLCLKQGAFHAERAAKYAEQHRGLEAAQVEGMHYTGGDPKKALQDKQLEHENKHRELTFIADHLSLSDDYLLDRKALAEIGVIRSHVSFFGQARHQTISCCCPGHRAAAGEIHWREEMQDFAKLFGAEDVGQVLVMKDSDDEGPKVTISFQVKDMGIAAMKLGFKDTDEGWNKRDRAFELFTEEQALDAARKNAAMFA